jgi:uncharacterized protein (TIGR02722 family)
MSIRCTHAFGAVLALVGAVVLGGCSTQVTRMDAGTVKDLSGEWNDTDSQQVSQEMITQMLDSPWAARHQKAHGGELPAVIVGTVKNLSHEHINVNTFVNDIQRAVVNSGRADFVASKTEREEVRDERKDQDVNASEETRKAMGKELGADYMLSGSINTIIDSEGRTAIRYYQVDLTLISLTDNRKVWIGQKKIKKQVDKPGMRL